MLPVISVVIPSYRRPPQLAACLEAMAALEYPADRFEVLVIDDGSPEPLEPVVARFQSALPVRTIRQKNRGPASARNLGIQNARGDLIAFTDDDCRPRPDWLLNLAQAYERDPEAAFGGAVINALPQNIFAVASQLLVDYLREYWQTTGRNGFFTSNNLAFPAEDLKQLGGFDEQFPLAAGEDREICDRWLRRGRRLVYVPAAVVSHSHNLTFRGFVRQHFNYGKGANHFHGKRALQSGDAIKVEPLTFYSNLMRYPLRAEPGVRVIRVTALFAMSQLANIAGFIWAAYRKRSPGQERARSHVVR